jgi:hypothetical protein
MSTFSPQPDQRRPFDMLRTSQSGRIQNKSQGWPLAPDWRGLTRCSLIRAQSCVVLCRYSASPRVREAICSPSVLRSDLSTVVAMIRIDPNSRLEHTPVLCLQT